MALTARCHSLRPDRMTGWLSYFELQPRGSRNGHFLVVGPEQVAPGQDPEAALRAGQAAVRYLKEVPSHATPLVMLEAIARILRHESVDAGVALEFACAVLEGDQLWLLTRGQVRMAPLNDPEGGLIEAPQPLPIPVDSEQKYFLGRVPAEREAEFSRERLSSLEHAGAGDGGLVFQFAEGAARPVRLAPKPAGPATPPTFEAVLKELQQSFDFVDEPASTPPPSETPGATEASGSSGTIEPPVPEAPEPATASPEPEPKAATPTTPASESPESPVTVPPEPESEPEVLTAAREALEQEPDVPDRPAGTYAPEETRGIGFYLGMVGAVVAIAALAVYVFILRPDAERMFAGGDGDDSSSAAMANAGARVDLSSTAHAILWEESLRDAVTSSPVVADGKVIFGCRDGRVYALDPHDGSRTWAYAAQQGFGSSPAVGGDLVVIGGYDGKVYGLDLTTGQERWTASTGAKIVASPAVDGDLAFVGSFDRNFYALSLVDGSVVWTQNLGAVLWASPLVADGRIIVAGLDGSVHALDRDTGKVSWRSEVGGGVYSSPAYGENKVFVGSKDGYLYAFDATTGELHWKLHAEAAVNGSPAYHEGRVVVGTDAGTVLGVDASLGQEVWRVSTSGEIKSRPAFLGRTVWLTGYDGYLHGIEWLTGNEAALIETQSSAYSSPAIADGVAYFGAMDGRFFAVRLGLKVS